MVEVRNRDFRLIVVQYSIAAEQDAQNNTFSEDGDAGELRHG